jgi:hypothetical protein
LERFSKTTLSCPPDILDGCEEECIAKGLTLVEKYWQTTLLLQVRTQVHRMARNIPKITVQVSLLQTQNFL